MPQVLIETMPSTFTTTSRESLKNYLRYECPRLFSVEDRELNPGSFSLMFPVFGEGSVPMLDVVIRIRLNDDPTRLKHAELHAEHLYDGVRETLYAFDEHRGFTVGICLDYGTKLVWCDANGPI